MDARPRRPGHRQRGREPLLHPQRAGDRWPGPPRLTPTAGHPHRRAGTPEPRCSRRLSPGSHPSSHPPRATGRRGLAQYLRRSRTSPARVGHQLPARPELSTAGRRRGVDRCAADDDLAVPRETGARHLIALARTDAGTASSALAAGGHIQQRLQTQRLRRGIHHRRAHLRTAQKRSGHDRSPPRRQDRHHQVARRAPGSAQRRLRPPEPPPDHRSSPPQPQPLRRTTVGRDARKRRPCLALRAGHRSTRQPHLCRRQRSDRGLAGPDPPALRRRAGHGTGHQHLLDELHQLPTSRRLRSGQPPGRHGPLTAALPHPRRPRLLCRLPAATAGRRG
jgi:hypothetical protein